MKRYVIPFLIAIFLTAIFHAGISAQRPSGSISGRVISDDGQPLPTVRITIIATGGSGRSLQARAMIATDEDGNFKVDGLDSLPYRLFAHAPGYISTDQENFPGSPVMGTVSAAPYRVGDFVTLTMTRGAVITGRVLTAAGEPVVGINVRAMKVRDQAGRPVAGDPGALTFINKTDDRGVYRIYGLAAGSYVVVAGGGAFSAFQTPFDARMPIYHPSSPRDTAAELTLRNGEEMTGVDIRYRAERGLMISGKVTGVPATVRGSGMGMSVTSIALNRAATGELVAMTVVSPNSDQNGFAFYGISPGEYEIEAIRSGITDENPMISEPRKVTVTGADVTGVNLTLTLAPSIAGTVVFEEMKEEEKRACEPARESKVEEVQLFAVRNETGGADQQDRSFLINQLNAPSADARGAFTIRGLRAAHYRLRVSLPSVGLYLKSMAFEKPDRQPGREGIVLKAGERVTGLKISAVHGAASLSGKVEAGEGKALRVYLAPREAESKDDVLRYYEVPVEGVDFKFTNLAPGKYGLVIKSGVSGVAPLAWNPAERAALAKEAEDAGKPVELSPCQKIVDFR